MFFEYFLRFLKIFSKGYKYKLVILLVMSVVAGFLEFFGIALIFPLIILILQPEQVANLPYLSKLSFALEDIRCVTLVLTGAVVGAFVLKNVFMLVNTYYQTSVLKNWQCELNLIFFRKYLFSTYESKLSLPSKFSIFQVWQLCALVFCNFVSRVLNLLSNVVILSVIVAFLLWKFSVWTLITGVFFVICGLAQNKFFKTKGQKYVQKRLEYMDKSNRSILSAINNIKDIKIFARESYFYNAYKQHISNLTHIDVLNDFYSAVPQNIIEICIIISILIMSYGVVSVSNGNANVVVASLGMLAAAVFRMAPLVNKIQMHLNFIIANKPVVKEMFEAYDVYQQMPQTCENTDEKFEFNNEIRIENLTFTYGGNKVLDGINAVIKKGEFVGIIGASGVGKTTFADILTGLLTSYSGRVEADGLALKEKTAQKWLNSVGYVPQEITTMPVSIAENIAFGVEPEKIDYEKISEVIKAARLDEYISRLKDGVFTRFNDIQGLSQGQKQRLGLARALYKEPEILFLDEFTSALDVETESKIVECLNALKGEKTIIAIAHRLSTLKSCDKILYFKSSKEVLAGTFEELVHADKEFEHLVKLSSLNRQG